MQYDADWSHTNIGQFLHDMVGLEQAFVIDAGNRPIYGMVNSEDVDPASYIALAAQAAPLIEAVREKEAQRPPIVARPPYRVMVSKPIQNSAIALVGGRPAVISASLVQPDFGTAQLPGRAPVVVTVEQVNAKFLRSFGQRFLLSGLDLNSPDAAARPARASYYFRDRYGKAIGSISWRQQTPGYDLLQRSLPPVLLTLFLLIAVIVALARRAQRGRQALIASESRSSFMAHHDHLTGLPNRALLLDRMAMALRNLGRSNQPMGVFMIDLDRFKHVNDCYGHGAGDALIIDIARRLKGLLRTTDTICRLGGDEFAILCTAVSAKGMAGLAEKIVSVLAEPIHLDFGKVFVGASVGVTVVTEAAVDPGEALRQADLAMYAARGRGRRLLLLLRAGNGSRTQGAQEPRGGLARGAGERRR